MGSIPVAGANQSAWAVAILLEGTNMKNKHLVVVSVDALVYEDLEYAKTLPNFGRLIDGGARINKVHTIYPSLTHPVHATMMSGNSAGKTGVVSNELFLPGEIERPWFNFLSQMQCETIFHAAHRAGLTTAACRWPLTANGDDVIDYLVPEVLPCDMEGLEDKPLEVYRKLGSQECLMPLLAEAIEKYGYENVHPSYDEFEIYCCCEIIRRYKPNILFTHPSYVDSMRHRTGIFSNQIKIALDETDKWLGMLFEALDDAGIADETDFVVVSDHGQLNICRTVCPNVFLADRGYIRVDANGKIESWDAYIASAALSGHVYISRPELKQEIYALLCEMAEEKIYGFDRVFTAEEVKEKYGLYGEFSFVIETDGFTSFGDDWVRPIVRDLDISDYRFGKGTHGHMPEKGPQPTFIAKGPSFKNVILENGEIVNHAPTFAKVLGLSLPEAEGRAVDELLK